MYKKVAPAYGLMLLLVSLLCVSAAEAARNFPPMSETNFVEQVSCTQPHDMPAAPVREHGQTQPFRVAVLDCGVKQSILERLREEFFARDIRHGIENSGVGDVATHEVGMDHRVSCDLERFVFVWCYHCSLARIFCRPFGACLLSNQFPGVYTPGYYSYGPSGLFGCHFYNVLSYCVNL